MRYSLTTLEGAQSPPPNSSKLLSAPWQPSLQGPPAAGTSVLLLDSQGKGGPSRQGWVIEHLGVTVAMCPGAAASASLSASQLQSSPLSPKGLTSD
jgi:hypothetical protein